MYLPICTATITVIASILAIMPSVSTDSARLDKIIYGEPPSLVELTVTLPEQPFEAFNDKTAVFIAPPSGSHEDWMLQAGIPQSEWPAVDEIFKAESGWRLNAVNELGCRGLGQACPGSKLPCTEYQAVCQVQYFYKYMKDRYGGAWQALSFRNNHNPHWY